MRNKFYWKYKTDGKQTIIDRVCPLCRVQGRNINLFDARNPENDVNVIIATCCTCKGLYHLDAET